MVKSLSPAIMFLAEKNSRLSDIIAKAGGITPDAYVKGASLNAS